MPPTEVQPRTHLLRKITAALAVTFLVVGVAGFVPGITSGYDSLEWYGHDSDAMLLGIFQVSVLHNVLHLLLGVAGLVCARSDRLARAYLVGGGSAYALLFVFGLFLPDDHRGNVVPLNNADNWLHLTLAATMIGTALLVHGRDQDDEPAAGWDARQGNPDPRRGD